jgi:hypothetical protein
VSQNNQNTFGVNRSMQRRRILLSGAQRQLNTTKPVNSR